MLSTQLTDYWKEFLLLSNHDKQSFVFVILNMLVYVFHVTLYCLCYRIVNGQNYKFLGNLGTWVTVLSIILALWGLYAVTRDNFVQLIEDNEKEYKQVYRTIIWMIWIRLLLLIVYLFAAIIFGLIIFLMYLQG